MSKALLSCHSEIGLVAGNRIAKDDSAASAIGRGTEVSPSTVNWASALELIAVAALGNECDVDIGTVLDDVESHRIGRDDHRRRRQWCARSFTTHKTNFRGERSVTVQGWFGDNRVKAETQNYSNESGEES